MLQPSNYLSLKQAAQQLGVHEQTLRSWERQGLIHLARLPKSGYRRVPIEEVVRIQTAMHTSQPPADVYMEPPRKDDAAVLQAQALAAVVRAEMANLSPAQSFDEFMQAQRGRAWLP